VEVINSSTRKSMAALSDPKLKARLADLGGEPLPGSPEGLGRLVADDTEKWAEGDLGS
jgi:hypothetical protein